MSHPYWIWLPQICSCNQNSQWYSICRKPCLFYPFSPLIVLGHHQLAPRFLVLWNVWNMHQVHLLEFLNMAASDCSCNQNSQWYCICRKPCLSYPFLPLIIVCRGVVNWRCGFQTYGMCETCIRCVSLSSWIWLSQICSCNQNSQWYCIATNRVSPPDLCQILRHVFVFIKQGEYFSYHSSPISSRVFNDSWTMAEEWEQLYQGTNSQEGQWVSRCISRSSSSHLSFGSSSYAASMTSATIDYKVKHQVELVRRM